MTARLEQRGTDWKVHDVSGEQRGKLEFSKTTRVDPLMIVNLVQQESQTYRLEGSSTLRITCELESFDQRLAFAGALLTKLTPQQEAAA